MSAYNTFIKNTISSLDYPGASYLDKKMIATYMWNQQNNKPISDCQKYAMLCVIIDRGIYTYEEILTRYGPYETVALYRTLAKWKQEEVPEMVCKLRDNTVRQRM
jgi:hypothetical protein